MEDMEIFPTCTSILERKGFIQVGDVIPNNPKIIPVSDLSPSEAAISIDHVKAASLKSCRLVSSRWKEFGASALRKRVSINTYFCYKLLLDADNICHYNGDQYILTGNCPRGITPSCHKDEPSPRSVSLINLILSVMSSSTNFPCDSFVMSTETLSSPQILSFLSVAGPSMKRLRLILVLFLGSSPPHHSPIMTQLKTLLMTQCPHLESFDLQLALQDPNLKKEIRETPHPHDTHEKHFLNSKMSSKSHQENPAEKMSLPHLKYFTLRSQVPFQFFTQIMEGATKLEAYYGLGYSQYFTEQDGRCRLHLLKQLDFELSVGSESAGAVNHILCHHRNNLRLEWIRITISSAFLLAGEYSSCTWRELVRAVSILNDLLNTSRKTLKKLTIPSLTTRPGLRIPHMPKLESLVLLKPPHESVHSSLDKHFFPPLDVNVLSLFPVLSAISIVSLSSEDSYDLDVRTLVNVPWPIPRIRCLRVVWPNYISWETRNLLSHTLPNSCLEQLAEEDWREGRAMTMTEPVL